MRAITEWLRSVGRTAHASRTQTGTSPTESPQPSLFHCPDCERVYIDTDKQTCSTCETAVEQVPSTFSEL